jgi:hypothetical protein
MTEDQLYKLNFYLLLELRVLSRTGTLEEIHRLVDCFHNLPDHLRQIREGTMTVEDAVSELYANVDRFHLQDWLENKMRFL